jgi:hypothetical protein
MKVVIGDGVHLCRCLYDTADLSLPILPDKNVEPTNATRVLELRDLVHQNFKKFGYTESRPNRLSSLLCSI